MRVYVTRRARFSAAHSYQNLPAETPGGSRSGLKAPGAIHGHNYTVDLTCAGQLDGRTGMVVNITEIDTVLKTVLEPLDQSFLEEDHPEVAWGLPTTENLARWIWRECEGKIPPVALTSVRVQETEDLWSEFRGDREGLLLVTRSYEFAAAHRLHSALLSDEENLEVFGKCNNPNGHGHNYALEITAQGEVDPVTGMACNISELDQLVDEAVLKRFDHKHLNLDLPEFLEVNPTSENLAIVIWNILAPRMEGALHRVRVRETERNYFDYMGEE